MSKAKYSVLVVEDEKLIAKNISKNIERANDRFEVVAIDQRRRSAGNDSGNPA